MTRKKRISGKIRQFWKTLGPGLVTGASDDDPSGIATYSQAGAQFGSKLLWTAIATYPLIVAVQEMCARIGLVTRHGLTGVIRRHYPKPVLYFIILLSFPSITLNIGADIAGMGAVANLLVPQVPSFIFSIVFTVLLTYAIIFWKYKRIAMILKWLCIALFSYILIPFLTHTQWVAALKNTVVPNIELNQDYFMALVGILGTTISPYLFFWQASMEVEEIHHRRLMVDKRILSEMETDVKGGLLLTNIVFYFIILTTGSVLFNSGIHHIDTVEEAAQALKPLAGKGAYLLFSVGVIGTGALAIPVLAGSLSYMMAETFRWKEGLDKTFSQAKGFYITIIVSLLVGLLVQFSGISPVRALIYTAVLYGIVAPFLIAIILHICNNEKIMGQYRNSRWANMAGVTALVVMTASAAGLIFTASTEKQGTYSKSDFQDSMDYDAALAEITDTTKPVLLFFNAHGAAGIRKMEEKVFNDKNVFSSMVSEFHVINLYVDDRGELDERSVEAARKKFPGMPVKTIGQYNSQLQIVLTNTNYQPCFAVFNRRMQLIHRSGYTPDPLVFLEFLQASLEKFRRKGQ